MKLYIDVNEETTEINIDIIADDFSKTRLCDAMPYIIDALYEMVVKENKKNMLR